MAAFCFSIPMAAWAEGGVLRKADRAGSWDFMFPITYAAETKIDGEGGSSVDINDDFGFGLGAGYNFNNHFQLGGYFKGSRKNKFANFQCSGARSARREN
jgi:hypothetical protein